MSRSLYPFHNCVSICNQIARVKFVIQNVQVFEKTKRSSFLKNRFHISEGTQSNQNGQRDQYIMIGCVKGVKFIRETTKSFPLIAKEEKPLAIICDNYNV